MFSKSKIKPSAALAITIMVSKASASIKKPNLAKPSIKELGKKEILPIGESFEGRALVAADVLV